MGEQVRAMYQVLAHPKSTFLALPANRVYALGVLAPLYFGVARAFQPRRYEALRGWLGGDLQIGIFAVVIGLVMIPVGAWLIRQMLKLFKKRLSVVKLMNIYGYALVPRLIVAGVGYLVLLSNRTLMSAEKPSTSLIVLWTLGFSALLYTIVLHVYGIVVCPSEEKEVPVQIGPPQVR